MVEFNNLTLFEIDEFCLGKIIKNVLRDEESCEACNVSAAFIGAEKMRELNKKHRGIDKTTDVLSFEYNSGEVKGEMEIRPLGEIIICLSFIEEQIKENGNDFKKELCCVLIHGLLHLLGYDHEKGEEEAKRMEEKQDYYVQKYCAIC
ncbi:MAG: rRNA maturation RNase YbeY [Candidatus Pacebacteria bacterium]|nr:rRNA maturation RNase YbeY [Candidatus Paceibacterota bacterium]